MTERAAGVDIAEAVLKTFATSDRVNGFLIESLPADIWNAKVPGGRGKTIAGIFAHIHNIRCMWIKMLGKKPGIKVPARLDRSSVTQKQAARALKGSRAAMLRMLEYGLTNRGKIPGFPPDVVHFLGYFVAHEAHHRGQICMLARQLGYPLPRVVSCGLWQWSKRSKEE